MVLQFNDEVAQVAGNDIHQYHTTVHFHFYATPAPAPGFESRNRSIHLLLRKCELAGIKPMVERISGELYGSRYFKSLTDTQIATLHAIADEICEVLLRSRGQYAHAARRVSASAAW